MSVSLEHLNTIMSDVQARLKSLPEHVTENDAFEKRISSVVKQIMGQVQQDPNPDVYRKMSFQSPVANGKLLGSKFARHGLTASDVEFLYDLQVAVARGGNGQGGPSEELTNAFKAISDAYYLPEDEVRKIDKGAIDNMYPRIPLSWYNNADRELAAKGMWWATQAYQNSQKAMDSAEAGYGQQLIGAEYIRDLWDAARSESRVFNLIPQFEMTDPTAYYPVEADLPEMLLFSEATSANATFNSTTKSGTRRVQVDAKKLGFHQQWSGDLDEDSLIPFVPFLRRQLALAAAHYSDSLVLNGDTTNAATGNINLNDADPADTKHYLAFDGIRKAGLVDNSANSKDAAGAVTYNLLRGQYARMKHEAHLIDWGHPTNPNDLIHVADLDTADAIANLDEVMTVDKFGTGATVLTGQQARIGQHPLIASMAMSKTQADGKVSTTAGNNVKGQVVAFNRNGFRVGWRRRIRIETFREIRADQNVIVIYMRLGFGRYSSSGGVGGIESADALYNISL